ncbi:OB-fold domain-containing protein [Rhodococcus sp. IEGM 1366]|uniref:OB-fold domain-containing protein n=1 Tax=Rhodococcus sp. IEGM 1366 TaxID=3082223 RepID=UPI00295443FB|nr:OB-fold domain-containing protein [Rhodococcus sp. IEGM 1366]MDV8071032.1 OB-fold domain-containing protein [Rhodococcus sp. IEGM 1366]
MSDHRGVCAWGVYIPHHRLDRSTIAPVAGTGGGRGVRAVASHDEDTTTMGVEAARAAFRSCRGDVKALWFATATPSYFDRTNATAIHAALRLDRTVPAYDALGSVRSGLGALRAALVDTRNALVITSDIRTGLPGGPDESAGGDAAAALLIGNGTDTPVLATVLAHESLSDELLDRWRTPGAPASKVWEERFSEALYTPIGTEALKIGLAAAGIAAEQVDHLVVAGLPDRAISAVTRKSGINADRVIDRLDGVLGNPGTAQPTLLLASALEQAEPGQHIVVLSLADGADVLVLRTTDGLSTYRSGRPVADQLATGGPVSYGRYLAWRGLLPVEPPRRPEPARVSSPAAARNADWKFAFTAGGSAGEPHLPPRPTDTVGVPMADVLGTIVTFTIDRLSYSQSPPVVFAVVDFDGGGRLPVELTDVKADEVEIGQRVEMTFRKLSTSDGIHNYFWKARLHRSVADPRQEH